MKYKTKKLADRFTSIISQWEGVECIALNEAALPDILDPYFALILDVYYRGNIPSPEERRRVYGDDLIAFETSRRDGKDRFLIGDLPVRLEYKAARHEEELVSIAAHKPDSLYLIKASGTYGFYRLAHGEILFSRSGWIDGIRRQLESLGEDFWEGMRVATVSRMDHFLSDLGAAFFQGDGFNYLVSAALFIKTACLALFCINRRFEPSHRAYYKQVLELPRLPESFPGMFESFLSNEPDMTMERKFKVAQLITRSIVVM